jgi:hypothetical protein
MSMVPAPAAPRRAPRPGGRAAPRVTPSRPPLTVVRPRTATPPRAPFVLLVAGILSAGLVTLLLLNTALSQGSFTVTDLQQQAAALADREQTLAQQLASHESPGKLAASAAELGMVPGRNPVFLRTSDGKILGEPAPGVAAPKPEPVASERNERPDANASPDAQRNSPQQPAASGRPGADGPPDTRVPVSGATR